MSVNLVLLAKGAAFNISADKGSQPGPPEFGGDQLMHFQEAGVSSGFVIMASFQDGTAKRVVRGNIDTAFVGEDAGLDLPVCQLGTEGERNILVHGLEGLQDEGVTCRGGFDTVREGSVDEVDEKGQWEEGDVGVVGVIGGE